MIKWTCDKGLGKIYKQNYCEGDKTTCARYKVATTLGKEFVPSSLYPNMNEAAERIIAEHN
jgi:hypothetical protein